LFGVSGFSYAGHAALARAMSMRSALLKILRYLTRRLAKGEMQGARAYSEARQVRGVIRSTLTHDMAADADEDYYRAQYWLWIQRGLADACMNDTSGRMLDLGCGQGRLTTLLAGRFPGAQIIGIDLSGAAIERARDSAKAHGLANVAYKSASIESSLADCANASVELVLFCEVTFFFPAWRAALDQVARVLRPGGVMCVAFRPQYFDALRLAQLRLFENTALLLEQRNGYLFGDDIVFTWQSSAEIRNLIERELHMQLLHLVGIGCCSGIAGDPHELIARPSRLAQRDRDDLMRIELALGPQLPDTGRYMLAIAQKPRETA
jgi:ubiquinone/menaquinone biosynthesis C-methylase UbiE